MSRITKIFIPYYSMYNHVAHLASAIKVGVEKVPNVSAQLYQIPETIPKEVLERIKAPPKADVPVLTGELMKEADGFLFGIPTRFGTMPSQYRAFFDSIGGIWASGALNGKFAGTFVSSNSQHGGQETTHLTFLTTLAHFGMTYVPLGYRSKHVGEDNEVIGGSPYGASVIVGSKGNKVINPKELEIAEVQGETFAKTVSQYLRGEQK